MFESPAGAMGIRRLPTHILEDKNRPGPAHFHLLSDDVQLNYLNATHIICFFLVKLFIS